MKDELTKLLDDFMNCDVTESEVCGWLHRNAGRIIQGYSALADLVAAAEKAMYFMPDGPERKNLDYKIDRAKAITEGAECEKKI